MNCLSKIFCKTVRAGVVIFGKQVDNDVLLYSVIANQPHAYSSPYFCWIFFLSLFGIMIFLYPRFEKVRVYWFT